jgi:2-polyprenyl-3-methyl-5-hydroxy-6-metoxy-1,4-benzoquinol methylase
MKVHEEPFDARQYWEQLLEAHPDITGVGYPNRSSRFGELQYRQRKHQVELALRHHGLIDLTRYSVLDVGSGIGIWLNFWHQHEAGRVVGIDFARPSVDILKKDFPDDLIIQADLSVTPLPLPDTMRFDIISAFDVLLHIVDTNGFSNCIANLAAHCAPGGWLIISDPIVQGQGYVPARSYKVYNKVHSITEYREVLAAHGFAIESIRPTAVLLSPPLEAPNYLTFLALSAFWYTTGVWGRSDLFTSLVRPIVMPAEQLACRLCSGGSSPTSKIIFARKQD